MTNYQKEVKKEKIKLINTIIDLLKYAKKHNLTYDQMIYAINYSKEDLLKDEN